MHDDPLAGANLPLADWCILAMNLAWREPLPLHGRLSPTDGLNQGYIEPRKPTTKVQVARM